MRFSLKRTERRKKNGSLQSKIKSLDKEIIWVTPHKFSSELTLHNRIIRRVVLRLETFRKSDGNLVTILHHVQIFSYIFQIHSNYEKDTKQEKKEWERERKVPL